MRPTFQPSDWSRAPPHFTPTFFALSEPALWSHFFWLSRSNFVSKLSSQVPPTVYWSPRWFWFISDEIIQRRHEEAPPFVAKLSNDLLESRTRPQLGFIPTKTIVIRVIGSREVKMLSSIPFCSALISPPRSFCRQNDFPVSPEHDWFTKNLLVN